MLSGRVNSRLEVIVRLWIRGPEDGILETDVIVDTGFSGFLSLPQEVVTKLCLLRHGEVLGILADGTEGLFPVYKAVIFWHGRPRRTFVSVLESDPLLGMGMLYGSEFAMQVVENGEVAIWALEVS